MSEDYEPFVYDGYALRGRCGCAHCPHPAGRCSAFLDGYTAPWRCECRSDWRVKSDKRPDMHDYIPNRIARGAAVPAPLESKDWT